MRERGACENDREDEEREAMGSWLHAINSLPGGRPRGDESPPPSSSPRSNEWPQPALPSHASPGRMTVRGEDGG